ncbi:MAG: AmmeMemoRadiSam system radical SAM enzyme [Candidatus Brocadiae bacterium]|nr:AmmeMemoRadiSam system radical SAM enzyme [Candidatus Brocadiia bacterium]
MKSQKKEALFWKTLPDGRIQCDLCPHSCILSENQRGICQTREVSQGKLYSLYYSQVASIGQVDPIEKKPLYHFRPGSKVLSFGSISCNLQCAHCQNYSLSQTYSDRMMISLTVDKILAMAKQSQCQGIAWTYNEPTIHFETYYDWSQVLQKHGFFIVWVSNGYIQPEPLKKIAPFLHAINFDVKAFTEEFYTRYTKSRLQPVLESCILAKNLQIPLEITYLVIPTLNDSIQEINAYLDWVEKNLGKDTPLHFSRFHPDNQLTHLPPTPREKILQIVELAKTRKFQYVYAGNLYPNPYEDTFCPSCSQILVKRSGYHVGEVNVSKEKKCKFCNSSVNVLI